MKIENGKVKTERVLLSASVGKISWYYMQNHIIFLIKTILYGFSYKNERHPVLIMERHYIIPLKYSMVFSNPSRNCTVGCQSRMAFALSIIGCRCCGSSCAAG